MSHKVECTSCGHRLNFNEAYERGLYPYNITMAIAKGHYGDYCDYYKGPVVPGDMEGKCNNYKYWEEYPDLWRGR